MSNKEFETDSFHELHEFTDSVLSVTGKTFGRPEIVPIPHGGTITFQGVPIGPVTMFRAIAKDGSVLCDGISGHEIVSDDTTIRIVRRSRGGPVNVAMFQRDLILGVFAIETR